MFGKSLSRLYLLFSSSLFFPSLSSLGKRRRVRGKKRDDEGSRDRREGEIGEAAAVERRAEEEERREGERLGEE